MMNPEDLAAARHKEIVKARERVAKVEAALAGSRERCEELRTRLPSAVVRDREKLAAALVDSKPEPPSEAAKMKAELEREGERTEALVLAVDAARSEISKVVAENRAGWMRRAEHAMGKASSRYKKAIAELEAAREALDDEATLLGWLSVGEVCNASTDSLANRTGSQALSFIRTLELLREDCEHLVAYPARIADPAPVPEPRPEMAGVVRAVEW
jgi:hypothetical protein